jgi:cyclopropane fatty-acyl-phospholipid synthase-like methyltransferase
MATLEHFWFDLAMNPRRALRNFRTAHAGVVETEDGSILPPVRLRLGGHNFEQDKDYLEGAAHDVRQLEQFAGLKQDDHILDIGCGVGRLATGLAARFDGRVDYVGVDVDAGRIAWCRKHLGAEKVKFVAIDVANERYNPTGKKVDDRFALPLSDQAFDVIHLFSVFSHLEIDDTIGYLREFRRLLAPSGRVYLTAFIEDGVADMEINPDGYGDFPSEWSGPLHCVRYDHTFFDGLVTDAGLRVLHFGHQSEADGQSAVVLAI